MIDNEPVSVGKDNQSADVYSGEDSVGQPDYKTLELNDVISVDSLKSWKIPAGIDGIRASADLQEVVDKEHDDNKKACLDESSTHIEMSPHLYKKNNSEIISKVKFLVDKDTEGFDFDDEVDNISQSDEDALASSDSLDTEIKETNNSSLIKKIKKTNNNQAEAVGVREGRSFRKAAEFNYKADRKAESLDNKSHDDLVGFFKDIHRDRANKVLYKFMQALKNNRSLGWLVDLPYTPIHIKLIEDKDQGVESEVFIYLKADVKAPCEWLCLGDRSDSEEMHKLLNAGCPKKIKIVVNIPHALVEYETPISIVLLLAHQLGSHVAPYISLLEKALIRHRISAYESKKLMVLFEKQNKILCDHKLLHRGYLMPDWCSKGLDKSQYRGLIETLCRTFYKGANAKFLWDQYCKDVGSFHPFSGRLLKSTKKISRQVDFYQALEAYKACDKHIYPWLAKIRVHKFLYTSAMLAVAAFILIYTGKENLMRFFIMLAEKISF